MLAHQRIAFIGAGNLTEAILADLLRKLPRQGDTAKGELLAVDVGPIPRRFLTRTNGFFDSL